MKLQLSEIELTNGLKFWVRNNLDDEGLEINNALDSWLLRTEEYTALSFINYLKSKPNVKAVLVDAVVMPKIADIKGLVEQVEILFSYYDKDGEAKFSKDHFGSRLWIDTTRNYVEKIKSNFTV